MKRSYPFYIALFLSLFMLPIPFAVYPQLADKGPTWLGLDCSSEMTVSYAFMQHWQWGKDIISTFGPLGFLATRCGLGISRFIFLVFDLFIAFNFFFVFKSYVQDAVNKFAAVLLLICIVLLLNTFYGTDLPWVFMFFIFYWMYQAYTAPRTIYFLLIALLVAVCFYIKLNIGFLGLLLLAPYLAILYILKKINLLKMLAAFFTAVLFILAFAFILHVPLPAYIRTALEVLKGYNDVMYLTEEHRSLQNSINLLFAAMIILFIARSVMLIKKRQFHLLFFTLSSILYLFLLKKQATLRNDTQHLYEFIAYAPLILVQGNLVLDTGKNELLILRSSLIIAIISLLIKTGHEPIEDNATTRFTSLFTYMQELKAYDATPYLTHADKRYIPQPILQKINRSSIDIFPWDSEYLLEHKLNYAPRPDFQTLLAYTPYLQTKNEHAYEHRSPDYIIYDYDAIDERYPFNDDLYANLFITHNYHLEDTFTSNERWRILLKRNPVISPVKYALIAKRQAAIGDEIMPGNALITRIFVTYNLYGALRALLYKPPEIKIAYIPPHDSWHVYKTSAQLLKAGLLTDRMILTTKDFVNYLNNKDSLAPVYKLKILADQKYFDKKIIVEYLR